MWIYETEVGIQPRGRLLPRLIILKPLSDDATAEVMRFKPLTSVKEEAPVEGVCGVWETHQPEQWRTEKRDGPDAGGFLYRRETDVD